MVRFIRLSLNEKRRFFMVRIPDNREAESRKSPEYQGKTAQKLAQYGLKAARRAPQFSKRWVLLLWNLQTPGITRFPGFWAFSAYFTCFHAIQAADKENHRQFGGDFLTREEYQLIHICTRRPFHTINIHGDRHGLSEFFLTFTWVTGRGWQSRAPSKDNPYRSLLVKILMP